MRRTTIICAAAAVVALVAIGYAIYDDRQDPVRDGRVEVHEGDTTDAVTTAFGAEASSTVDEGNDTELWTWPGGWVRFRDGEAVEWHSLVYGHPKICDDP